MQLTTGELGRRLRSARDAAGLTQEKVAELLGIPRTAVVAIEKGERAISSLELSRLVTVYRRDLADFLGDQFMEDPIEAFFRAEPGMAKEPLIHELRTCAHLCKQLDKLEQMLQIHTGVPRFPTYALRPPSKKGEAIEQGRSLAGHERKRLGLGDGPILSAPAILRQQGIRVTEYPLPSGVSGMSFRGHDGESVIVVNRRETPPRRLFSYAHEYCHCLADSAGPGVVSRFDDHSLREVRANSFAAHLLMPRAGIERLLDSLGKRQSDGRYRDLHAHDVVLLAREFGVSYEAALFHLENVGFLPREQRERLAAEGEFAKRVLRALRGPLLRDDVHWSLSDQLLATALEAYEREEISGARLLDLMSDAGFAKATVKGLITARQKTAP